MFEGEATCWSILGGVVIAAGFGYGSPLLVGIALSLAGFVVLLWAALADRAAGDVPDEAPVDATV